MSSVFTEFPVAAPPPALIVGVEGITSGPDGRVWFVDRGAGQIGSIDAAGHVVKYDIPGHPAPVAIVTGSEGEGEILKAYNLGVDCYITKPIDVAKISAARKPSERSQSFRPHQ